MVTDQISEFINNIKMAAKARKEIVSVPHSKLKHAIADTLERHGYIKNISKKATDGWKTVDVAIVFDENGAPKVHGVSRVSKPSRRIYGGQSKLPQVKNGYGHLVISTSKGVMVDAEARKGGIGGEILFKIW